MSTVAYALGENGNKPRPQFRSYYRIGEIDYEWSDYEVIQAVSELLHNGAQEVSIVRVITTEPRAAEPEIIEESKDADFEVDPNGIL